MSKCFIGPYSLGGVDGLKSVLKHFERETQEPATDVEAVFYASAFQAGVDEFVLHHVDPRPCSDFLTSRTKFIAPEHWWKLWKRMNVAFSNHLPEGWESKKEFRSVQILYYFVVDLLSAMSAGASVLSAHGIPDMAEAESLLPSELAIPLANLFSAISDLSAPSPVPQKAVATESVQRFNEIMSSDLFLKYAAAHTALDDAQAPVAQSLPVVFSTARNVFARNKHLLRLRRASVGVLEVTPKLVDLTLGKLPGALAELAAKIGLSVLESRRRIVIYDLWPCLGDVLEADLDRVVSALRRREQS